MKRISTTFVSLFAGVVMTLSAFADPVVFYWRGGDGTWSDVSNWSMSSDGAQAATRYPGELGYDDVHQDAAQFTSSATGRIKVDVDVTLYRFLVDGNSSSPAMELYCDGARKRITAMSTTNGASHRSRLMRSVDLRNLGFTGKYLDVVGKTHFYDGCDLVVSATIYAWNAKAEATVEDGANVDGSMVCQASGAKLFLKGGSFSGSIGSGQNSGTYYKADIEVTGGSHQFDVLTLATDESSFKMSGGAVSLSGCELAEQANVAFTGGKISTGLQITDRRLLGSAAAVLETRNDSYTAVNVLTKEKSVADHTATLVATGGTYTALAIMQTNGWFRSTGTVIVHRLRIGAGVPGYFDIDTLVLGSGLSFANGGEFHFENGQTFDAYGDWYLGQSAGWGSVYLGGRQKFNTTDYFDGVTPHIVTFKQFYTDIDTDLEIAGCGTLIWRALKYTRLGEVKVGAGATFSPEGKVTADKLMMGAGAKVSLTAGKGSLSASAAEVDPMAKFVVTVPSGLEDFAYPVVDAPLANAAAQIEVSGAGSSGFSVANFAGVASYLKSTGTYVPPAMTSKGAYSNLWTGAHSANLNDAQNWRLGVVPASSTEAALYIDGYTNLDINNDLATSFKFKQLKFTQTCGPVRISGRVLNPASYSYFDEGHAGSSFVSLSPFPVLLDAPIKTSSSRLHFLSSGGSYFQVSNAWSKGGVYVSGHLKVAGSLAVAGGLYVTTPSRGSTLFEIGKDSRLVVSNQCDFLGSGTYYRSVWTVPASFRIHSGGKAEFLATGAAENVFGWEVDCDNLVDGELSVRCPFTAKGRLTFRGTGTVALDDVFATNANATVVLGNGVTFRSRGFETASAVCPDNFIALAVTNAATLAADDSDWRYGPAEGLAPAALSTTAGARALRIERGARLTIAGGAYAISFADPIVGAGTLSFAVGARLKPAGALDAAAGLGWTTVATVGAVENLANLAATSDDYRWRVVEQADGQLLQVKAMLGMMILLR